MTTKLRKLSSTERKKCSSATLAAQITIFKGRDQDSVAAVLFISEFRWDRDTKRWLAQVQSGCNDGLNLHRVGAAIEIRRSTARSRELILGANG